MKLSDLTSEAFIATLKRFFSRRGQCSTIWSDNATTFTGAKREINHLGNLFQNQIAKTNIVQFCSDNRTTWKFIPPRSPHFGGILEAAVKSFKVHLKKSSVPKRGLTKSF